MKKHTTTKKGVEMPRAIIRPDGDSTVFIPDEYIEYLIDRKAEEIAKVIHEKDFLK